MPRIQPLVNSEDQPFSNDDQHHAFVDLVAFFSCSQSMRSIRERLIENYNVSNNSTGGGADALAVLDFGCDVGDSSKIMIESLASGSTVTAIDDDSVLISRSIQQSSHPKCHYKRSSLTQLDFKDDSFDMVYAERVLHVLEEPQESMLQIARVLKRKGSFLLIEPDFNRFQCNTFSEEQQQLLREFFCDHCTIKDPKVELPTLLQDFAFKKIEIEEFKLTISSPAIFNRLLSFSSILTSKGVDLPECDQAIDRFAEAEKNHSIEINIPLVFIKSQLG